MTGKYRYLDHISDAYVECEGKTLEEAFESAGQALFDVMTDISKVKPLNPKNVEVKAEDLFALLFEWLSELLFLYDAKMMYFSRFKIRSIERVGDMFKLSATIWGEGASVEKHPPRTEVKAATYSLMEIIRGAKKVTLRFVVDI